MFKENILPYFMIQAGVPRVTCISCLHREPLNPEWNKLAEKQLKGADPTEKLTWHSPEVSLNHSGIATGGTPWEGGWGGWENDSSSC